MVLSEFGNKRLLVSVHFFFNLAYKYVTVGWTLSLGHKSAGSNDFSVFTLCMFYVSEIQSITAVTQIDF